MNALRVRFLAAGLAALFAAAPHLASAGPPVAPSSSNDPVLKWNSIAIEAGAVDHSGTYGNPEQGGPTATSRALAIVHIAIYDAVNAINGTTHEPYCLDAGDLAPGVLAKASIDAAVAQAAHDTLAELYPAQAAAGVFQKELDKALKGISAKKGRGEGQDVGAAAAECILAERDPVLDGSGNPAGILYVDPPTAGSHQTDPTQLAIQGQLGPYWGLVTPFAMDDVANFHAPAPPALDSPEYTANFNEVKSKGSIDSTTRTKEETEIGLFWGYDGSIGLGVPPRLYNQIARVIAQREQNTVAENARLFALVNMSMADAGIASWYTKYAYNLWRPVVAIRFADDGNDDTESDPNWVPLGAPATNGSNGGLDFTPPFPAYTSGHATFGAALFRTLENFYGTDDYEFSLKSDELSGRNTDSSGANRYTVVRRFDSFSQAAVENSESRLYLGIHWRFDATAGVAVGTAVADYVFDNKLQPLP